MHQEIDQLRTSNEPLDKLGDDKLYQLILQKNYF